MAELKLKPVAGTSNKVFVEPVKKVEKQSAGGIFMPVLAAEINQQTGRPEPVFPYEYYGKVLAVSDKDEKGVAPNIKVGETVYFGANFSLEEFDGIEYFLMKEGNIYGKL